MSETRTIQTETIIVATVHGAIPVTAECFGEFAVHPLIRGSWEDDRIATVTHRRTGHAVMHFAAFEDARGFAAELNESVSFANAEKWILAGNTDEDTLGAVKALANKWNAARLDVLLMKLYDDEAAS